MSDLSPLFQSYEVVAERVLALVDLSPLRGKRVLITGSNGLLGSHILWAILKANRDLNYDIALTAISKSEPNLWLKTAWLQDNPRFRALSLDLSKELPQGLRAERFDCVIHAATYGQPKKFIADPLSTMTLNADLTKTLLSMCNGPSSRFLLASTSELYGAAGDLEHPVHELFPAKIATQDARSVYTAAKLYAEVLCKVHLEKNLCQARIARISSAFGPGVNLQDDRVLNVFMLRAMNEGSLKIMDAGLQQRRWLYISDAVAMMLHILLHARDLVYNVSGTEILSIADLAKHIAKIANVPFSFPEQKMDAHHTKDALALINMDNTKIWESMGEPKLFSVESGLRETFSWLSHLQNLKREGSFL